MVFEPVRWEILRLLARDSLAESSLASMLNLSPPTVGHHLKALEGSGLIRIARTEVGTHGIVKKFYESSAKVYLADSTKMTSGAKRYFMPARIERTRGMLAALLLDDGGFHNLSTQTMETIMRGLEPFLLDAAKRREGPSDKEDPELVVNEIYRDALKMLKNSRPDLLSPNIPDA